MSDPGVKCRSIQSACCIAELTPCIRQCQRPPVTRNAQPRSDGQELAAAPGRRLVSATLKPRAAAQRKYMRSSISAQSMASTPPAPACRMKNGPRSCDSAQVHALHHFRPVHRLHTASAACKYSCSIMADGNLTGLPIPHTQRAPQPVALVKYVLMFATCIKARNWSAPGADDCAAENIGRR